MGPPKKTTFPAEFFDEYYTMYLYTKNSHIQGKKYKNLFFVSKWRPNNWFSFRVILISAKIWKTNFSKELFNEIFLIIGDHRYINIAEIKIGSFYFGGILVANHFSRTTQNANLYVLISEKTTGPIWIFFCLKRSVSMRVTITNNTGQNVWGNSSKICEKLW